MTRKINTAVKVHRCEPEEIETISQKYNLEINSHGESTWICLKVPEANTTITWFEKKP